MLHCHLLLVAHWYLHKHHGVVAGVGVLGVGQCRRRDGLGLEALEVDVEAAEALDESVGALDEEEHDAGPI